MSPIEFYSLLGAAAVAIVLLLLLLLRPRGAAGDGATTLALLGRLDAIVGEAHGRLYLAKDARMPRSLFEKGYPRWHELSAYRDPGISSAMSRRLLGA